LAKGKGIRVKEVSTENVGLFRRDRQGRSYILRDDFPGEAGVFGTGGGGRVREGGGNKNGVWVSYGHPDVHDGGHFQQGNRKDSTVCAKIGKGVTIGGRGKEQLH